MQLTSGRTLSIAKELFIQGMYHCQRKSTADFVLAILNFDFAAETLLKTVIIDNGGAISNGREYRNFYQLTLEFNRLFPTINLQEVKNLHELRNNVQHNSSIPSQQDVIRHKDTIQKIFDDICASSKLNYQAISLALFVNSKNERYILERMEEAYASKKYVDAVYYGKRAAEYHLLLLRSYFKIPRMRYQSPNFKNERNLEQLANGIDEVIEIINFVVDKLRIGDQYESLNQLFNGKIPSLSSYRNYGSDVRRDPKSSQTDADNCRNVVYEFITSTQEAIGILDLTSPYIFDITVSKNQAHNDYDIQVGYVCIAPIKEATIQIGDPFFDFGHENVTTNAPLQEGLHTMKLPTIKEVIEKQITVEVTNKLDEYDIIHYKF